MGLEYYVYLFNLKVYAEDLLPAYRMFFDSDDAKPLVALLKRVIHKLDIDTKLPGPMLQSKESYENDIGILNGTVHFNPGEDYLFEIGASSIRLNPRQVFVRDSLGHNLLFALCVPRDRGVDPEGNMGRSPLIAYLYERSESIQDLFTNGDVRGGELEVAVGESHPKLFTKGDVKRLSADLARVPQPQEPELRKEYDHLCAMVRLTLQDPDLTLLLSLL